MRYYVAMKMAERGLVSAPNMAVGQPFNIGITTATGSPMDLLPEVPALPTLPPMPPQPAPHPGAHAGYQGA